jgi:hypothetical protein
MYNNIIGVVDDEMWDIIEDGIRSTVDTDGIVTERKSLTATQKK